MSLTMSHQGKQLMRFLNLLYEEGDLRPTDFLVPTLAFS